MPIMWYSSDPLCESVVVVDDESDSDCEVNPACASSPLRCECVQARATVARARKAAPPPAKRARSLVPRDSLGRGVARTARRPGTKVRRRGLRSRQVRERLRYLLVKGAGPKWRPSPTGPPLVIPAPPLLTEHDVLWNQRDVVMAELRFALAQVAPGLPLDVRRLIMGFARLPKPGDGRVGIRTSGCAAPRPPRPWWRRALGDRVIELQARLER